MSNVYLLLSWSDEVAKLSGPYPDVGEAQEALDDERAEAPEWSHAILGPIPVGTMILAKSPLAPQWDTDLEAHSHPEDPEESSLL